MVRPIIQTFGFVIPEKFGVTISCLNSSKVFGTGNETKYLLVISYDVPLKRNSLIKTPTVTAIKAAGSNFIELRAGILFHISRTEWCSCLSLNFLV